MKKPIIYATFLFLAVLGAPLSAAGQDIDFGDDPTLPPGPSCVSGEDTGYVGACWKEIDASPGCYIRSPVTLQPDTWSGQCSGGLGTGTEFFRDDFGTSEFPYVDGLLHGTSMNRRNSGDETDRRWANGKHVCFIHRDAVSAYMNRNTCEDETLLESREPQPVSSATGPPDLEEMCRVLGPEWTSTASLCGCSDGERFVSCDRLDDL